MIELVIKLQNSQKLHNRIIQKELQMNVIKKIPKERFVSPEERQKSIDDLRLT